MADNKDNPPIVGTGAESFWHRRTNTYAGCTCPAWRYHPRYPKPTNPECEKHGEVKPGETGESGETRVAI